MRTSHAILAYSCALVGLAVEFSWAVGESVVLPYMQWLGVPDYLLGFLFVLNPMAVLVLQPFVGHWSDQLDAKSVLGRRMPFIVTFAIGSAIGVVLVSQSLFEGAWMSRTSSSNLERYLDQGVDVGASFTNNIDSIALSAAGLTFFGYFLLDISNDLLAGLGRIAATDWGTTSVERRKLNQVCTVLQMVGKCSAFAIGTLRMGRAANAPVRESPENKSHILVHDTALSLLKSRAGEGTAKNWGSSVNRFLKKVCHTEDRCMHMQTLIVISGGITMVICVVAWLVRLAVFTIRIRVKHTFRSHGTQEETRRLMATEKNEASNTAATHQQPDLEESNNNSEQSVQGTDTSNAYSLKVSDMNITVEYVPTSGEPATKVSDRASSDSDERSRGSTDDSIQEEELTCSTSVLNLVVQHKQFAGILAVQFTGWCCIMYQSFFWTIWVQDDSVKFFGLEARISFLGLFFQSIASLIMSLLLPRCNAKLGPTIMYFTGELCMMLALVLVGILGNGPSSILSAVLLGPTYAIHQNNAFTVAFSILDKSGAEDVGRGLVMAVINSTMPLAQILVGSLFALIVDTFFDGEVGNYFMFLGVVGGVIDIVLFALVFYKVGSKKKDGYRSI